MRRKESASVGAHGKERAAKTPINRPPGTSSRSTNTTTASLGCSVVGGEVYHGTQIPELAGLYVFGDYCSGEVWTLDPAHPFEPVRGIANYPYLVDITTDLDGELHLVSVADGVSFFEAF